MNSFKRWLWLALFLCGVGCTCEGSSVRDIQGQLATILPQDRLVYSEAELQKEFLLFNAGTGPLLLTKLVAPLGFELIEPPALPRALEPGESQGVVVKLRRHTTQRALVRLRVEAQGAKNADEQGYFYVELEHRVSVGLLSFSCDGALDFGYVSRGRTKLMLCKLRNRGQAAVVLKSARYAWRMGLPDAFRWTGPALPHRLEPDASLDLQVTYAPGPLSVGKEEGAVEIVTDLPPSAGEHRRPLLQVTGRTDDGPSATWPCLKVEPPVVRFKPLPVRCKRTLTHVRLSVRDEPRCEALKLLGASLSKGSDPSFTILQAPKPRAIAGSIRIELMFWPSKKGPLRGALQIETNQKSHPLTTIPLEGEGQAGNEVLDTFRQIAEPKIDVLLVLDNSPSMKEEQANLAANLKQHAGVLMRLKVDLQILLTTTDVSGKSHPAGCGLGAPAVLQGKTPDLASELQRRAQVGIAGSEKEQGLQAMYLALQPKRLQKGGCNEGFLRDGARLMVLVVSDEDDQSPETVGFYTAFLQSLKGGRSASSVSVFSVTGTTRNGLSNAPQFVGCTAPGLADAKPGRRYYQLTRDLKGSHSSICDGDWRLFSLPSATFGYRAQFFLSRLPEPSTIEVQVNGVQVLEGRDRGWTYSNMINSLYFTPSQTPPARATIEVRYQERCAASKAP